MADGGDPSRPSFSEFWKKSKEVLGGGKKIRFVESNPGAAGPGTGSSGAQDAASTDTADKAQLRRAQVRKAQTQHRQRKANYVKKLEMDVARIREMIEDAERDTKALLDENKAMRAQVLQAVNNKQLPLSLDQGVSLLKEMPEPPQLSSDIGTSLPQEADGVTVTLGFDKIMNAPTFYISSPPPSNDSHQTSPREISPAAPDGLPDLTPAQTQAAINFILALEHVCRAHFHPSLYDPPPPDTVFPSPLVGHEANGHTLMATSLALSSAPERIFKAASRSDRPTLFPSSSSPSSSTLSLRPTCRAITIKSTPTTTGTTDEEKKKKKAEEEEHPLSWKTSSLTLRSLHGLASSLNPDDAVELAPVQAWFELVRRFGAERIMAEGVLNELKREFVGVVKCPHFGACLERGAFESVVGRVLGHHGDPVGGAGGFVEVMG